MQMTGPAAGNSDPVDLILGPAWPVSNQPPVTFRQGLLNHLTLAKQADWPGWEDAGGNEADTACLEKRGTLL